MVYQLSIMKILLMCNVEPNSGIFKVHTQLIFQDTYTFIFSFLLFPWRCSWMSCHVPGFLVCKTWSGQGVYYPACLKKQKTKNPKTSNGRIINGDFKGSRIGNEVTQFGSEGGPPQRVQMFALSLRITSVLNMYVKALIGTLLIYVCCELFLYISWCFY